MQESVCRATVSVTQADGLHLRPLSLIAESVRRHDAEVHLRNGERSADAKNVLDLMTLDAQQGTEIEIETRGPDAQAVLDELLELFESDFPE
ncbi:MAG: HPr family phosphocarrier protein [Planctomycetaceae bacterium]